MLGRPAELAARVPAPSRPRSGTACKPPLLCGFRGPVLGKLARVKLHLWILCPFPGLGRFTTLWEGRPQDRS